MFIPSKFPHICDRDRKKIVYSQKNYPITDVGEFAGTGAMEAALKEIVAKHGGLWSAEAEAYFLENCPDI